jgi:hypothetical protein
MTRDELRRQLIGKTIRDVTFLDEDNLGNIFGKETDLVISSIEFTDGSTLLLEGSGQIGRDEVWVELQPPAMRI